MSSRLRLEADRRVGCLAGEGQLAAPALVLLPALVVGLVALVVAGQFG